MGKEWSVAWEYRAMDFHAFPIQTENETQVVTIWNNLRGDAVRVRLSNRYGTEPLRVNAMRLGCADWSGAVPMTVTGNGQFQLEPGEEVYTDPAPISLAGGERLQLMLEVPEQRVTTACSIFPQEVTDACFLTETGVFLCQAKTDLLNLEPEHRCFYGVTRLEVEAAQPVKTLVCFGDSITHRSLWTAPLTRRLYEKYPGMVSVLNYGISGNRMLHDCSPNTDYGPWFGERGLLRLKKELKLVPHPAAVIVLHGINDIYHPMCLAAPPSQRITAPELIRGLETYAAVIHEMGAAACCGTLTPFCNAGQVWDQAGEHIRTETNRWIRANRAYDAVVDFDKAVAEPHDAVRMRASCDSGDNLHPGVQGGLAMAACFTDDILEKLLGNMEESS